MVARVKERKSFEEIEECDVSSRFIGVICIVRTTSLC